MKFFTDQKNSKKIIISLLIVMLFNFISPTISSAEMEINAGVLFDPIADLLCTIGDYIIGGLQGYFVGRREITRNPIPDSEYDEYIIAYSPGIIFSGKVASLKTNFINAKEEDEETLKTADYIYSYVDTLDTSEAETEDDIKTFFYGQLGDKHVFPSNENTPVAVQFYYYSNPDVADDEATEVDLVWTWQYNNKTYQAIMIDAYLSREDVVELALAGGMGAAVTAAAALTFTKVFTSVVSTAFGIELVEPSPGWVIVGGVVVGFIGGVIAQAKEWIEETERTLEDVVVYERVVVTKSATKESVAFKLKDTVATWYVSLRTIALVGLLSVLVYIGIRILISSTGQEKAKYKKMIGDWLVALCLLFVLHYIMLLITETVQKITDVLNVNLIDSQGVDLFMTGIRQTIELNYEESFINIFMYLVLVVYTIIFTVQYVKRFFYVAFFTMIAPLVALTYPLDKIKDGQAQAFSVWLREYIFNSLLQPMHLLLYYMFVESAIELSVSNIVYAIVAIGFLLPAEKFFRKMFGFEKAESASQVNAAAGGALVVNAVNNAARKAGRLASKGMTAASKSGGSGGSGENKGADKGKPTNKGKATSKESASNKNSNNNANSNKNNDKTFNQDINKAKPKGKIDFKKGAKTLAGRYNPASKANRRKILKGAGRLTRKAVVGAAGAAALGTVGLAIGTATGDASKALGYGAAGLGTGYAAANNLGDRVTEFEKENRERFKEGALGTDEYNTRNSIKELTNDNDFNKTCKDLGITNSAEKDQLIRQFRENGITSSDDIKKSMSIRAKTGASQEEVIAAYKIKEKAEADKLERDDIIKRLSRQGVKDTPKDKSLSRAMEIIDKFYD